MKKDIAMKWVEALRSGKYEQGTINLYNERTNQYCCLGVLCEITGLPKEQIDNNGYSHLDQYLNSRLGTFKDTENGYQNLSSLNDSGARQNEDGKFTEPLSFDEIADVIQIHYKEL